MTCHRILPDRRECIAVIGITSGGYPAGNDSGRRVLSAQQVVNAVGIAYLAAALMDYSLTERTARSRAGAQTRAPAIFMDLLDPVWRTVAALDRVLARPTPSRISRSGASESSRAAWWRANSSVWSFQTLRTLGRERHAVELQGFLVYPFASVLPRATRAAPQR